MGIPRESKSTAVGIITKIRFRSSVATGALVKCNRARPEIGQRFDRECFQETVTIEFSDHFEEACSKLGQGETREYRIIRERCGLRVLDGFLQRHLAAALQP